MNKKFLIIAIGIMIIVSVFQRTAGFGLLKSPTAFAVGDLIVNWGVAGIGDVGFIFNVTNWLPGDSETRTVNIENGAVSPRAIAIKYEKTFGIGDLEEVLDIVISESGGADLYGGNTGAKTVKDFFDDSSSPLGIFLFNLDGGADKDIDIRVRFQDSAGNAYKNTSVVFNIIIGVTIEIPAECSNITFDNVIFGTEGNDNLDGGAGSQLIIGFEGNDKIDGGAGSDCIVGGAGVDRIDGGARNDVILGEEGNDKIDGGAGSDTILGGLDNDKIDGGSGNDNIFGGSENDNIRAGSGDDTVYGEEGSDNIEGNAGNDLLDGGDSHDTLKGGAGNDTLIGGAGTDTANGNTGIDTCDAETEISCEL